MYTMFISWMGTDCGSLSAGWGQTVVVEVIARSILQPYHVLSNLRKVGQYGKEGDSSRDSMV